MKVGYCFEDLDRGGEVILQLMLGNKPEGVDWIQLAQNRNVGGSYEGNDKILGAPK